VLLTEYEKEIVKAKIDAARYFKRGIREARRTAIKNLSSAGVKPRELIGHCVAIFGCNRDTIVKDLKALELPYKLERKDVVTKNFELVEPYYKKIKNGYPIKEVARKTGLSYQQVWFCINKHEGYI